MNIERISRKLSCLLVAFFALLSVSMAQVRPSLDANPAEAPSDMPENHFNCEANILDQAFDPANFSEAVTSDRTTPFAVSENFTPSQDILANSVCWTGIYFDFTSGPCGPPAGDSFEITYSLDNAGQPGAIVAGPVAVTADREMDVPFFPGLDNYSYQATHAPVALTAGQQYWITITNTTGIAGCVWLWTDNRAGVGDGLSFQTPATPRTNDMAVTIGGTVEIVPTMGEWGVIILGLLIMIFGIVAVTQRKTAVA